MHSSRKTDRDKGVTKEGRSDTYFVLVDAARVAVQTHPFVKRIDDKHKIVVAMAANNCVTPQFASSGLALRITSLHEQCVDLLPKPLAV